VSWISIDWLCIKQAHIRFEGSLPHVGEWVHSKRNLHSDFVTFERVSGTRHEGSWQSSLRVTCDGVNVTVEGNPSRFGRMDNLFGFTDIREAVEVFQGVLREYGLPEFDFNVKNIDLWAHDNKRVFRFYGATFHRVDLCSNHISGSMENARQFLVYLSGLPASRGLVPHIYPDGNTVDYGGNGEGKKGTTYLYRKWYIKGVEQEKNLFKIITKEKLCDEDLLYGDRLLNYVKGYGIVRYEVSFKRKFLYRKGYHVMDRVVCLFDEFRRYEDEHLLEDGGRVLNVDERPGSVLVGKEIDGFVIGKRFARVMDQVYYAWKNGEDVREIVGKSTFYKVRSVLKNYGVDISRPCTVVRMPVEVRKIVISPVESPPYWYRLPGA
jgi:hypothetical protein